MGEEPGSELVVHNGGWLCTSAHLCMLNAAFILQSQQPDVDESQLIAYDRHHETKRKEQLEKLLNRSEGATCWCACVCVCACRTAEQVQEEEVLMAEFKKIEMRKKERERKQQDLQKLISAAEHNTDRFGVSL